MAVSEVIGVNMFLWGLTPGLAEEAYLWGMLTCFLENISPLHFTLMLLQLNIDCMMACL